jgi:hypothetical protein
LKKSKGKFKKESIVASGKTSKPTDKKEAASDAPVKSVKAKPVAKKVPVAKAVKKPAAAANK